MNGSKLILNFVKIVDMHKVVIYEGETAINSCFPFSHRSRCC